MCIRDRLKTVARLFTVTAVVSIIKNVVLRFRLLLFDTTSRSRRRDASYGQQAQTGSG